MHEYFPLERGAVREYDIENAQGKGSLVIEILDVVVTDAAKTAKCRRTVRRPGEKEAVVDFTVIKDADGVREGDSVEFKHPLKVGTEWIAPPRRHWIEALDAAVKTPAGEFKACLKVAYLIAEGDGGSGERHYAPGVGLVSIEENDEADPYTCRLVRITG